MSTFSDRFINCMEGKSMLVPNMDSLNEAKEFVDQLLDAWEKAGGDKEMTIGALVVVGAACGIDETALLVLNEVAGILVTVYIAVCVACLASSGIDALRDLFATSPAQPFMIEELARLGININPDGTAIA